MRLFDYSQYDKLHQSLVDYYGSETALKFAIMKEQKPAVHWAMFGAAVDNAVIQMKRLTEVNIEASKTIGKIKIRLEL